MEYLMIEGIQEFIALFYYLFCIVDDFLNMGKRGKLVITMYWGCLPITFCFSKQMYLQTTVICMVLHLRPCGEALRKGAAKRLCIRRGDSILLCLCLLLGLYLRSWPL